MSKYLNKKTNGYDSKKESLRAAELRLMEKAGRISMLQEQVRFEIIPKLPGERASHYVADFVYIENGKQVVEDVKSSFTRKNPVYQLKRKMMNWIHGIQIRETCK